MLEENTEQEAEKKRDRPARDIPWNISFLYKSVQCLLS